MLLAAIWINHWLSLGSHWIGWPISPVSLSDTLLKISSCSPLSKVLITWGVLALAFVFDDANWIESAGKTTPSPLSAFFTAVTA